MPKLDIPAHDLVGSDLTDAEVDAVDEVAIPKVKPAKKERVAKPSVLAGAKTLSDKVTTINVLYSGDPGTGKTTAAAHMAKLGKVIIINAEGGVHQGPLRRMGIDTDRILVLPEDPDALTADFLEDLYWELKAKLAEDPDYIAGVVWDSITEIHQRLLRNVVEYQLKRAALTGKSRISGAVAGDMLNQAFTDLGDYGIMTEQMRKLLRRYCLLECHFAITSLLRRDMDDDGKVVYRPAVTPALQKDLEGFVQITGITGLTDDDEYVGVFRPKGKFRGKDRLGVLPEKLVNPTFDTLVYYANGTLTVEGDGA